MNRQIEFGDFQTPQSLADRVCLKLRREGINPSLIVEPTCGLGNFLDAAQRIFPDVQELQGFEINSKHVKKARERFANSNLIRIFKRDVMHEALDLCRNLPKGCLILGNPPWTTNSKMGQIDGTNLPEKGNVDTLKGMDALTGKSNFDISEWMLMRFTELLNEIDGHLAMLVKTSVARKIILRMFKSRTSMTKASIHRIDTAKEFDVSVDACLLVIRFSEHSVNSVDSCEIFDTLEQERPVATLGWRDGKLVSNPSTYDRLASRYLASAKPELLWRSGIKHDCSKVFELKMQGGDLVNGHGDVVDIEYEYLFPLLKCTDLAHDRKVTRWVICPQKRVGADTKTLEGDAPYLWKYLAEYSDRIDNRRSKIYLNKPRFSIFGIGAYSFQPWKIAISGLHKSYDFRLIGPHASKPVLFDDTCYQLGFNTRQEAEKIYTQVTDDMCVEFLNSVTFWDNKRPVTADILNQLHIASVSTQ